MESLVDDIEDQEVTVEVLPQTVTEITYLNGHNLIRFEPYYYIEQEPEEENEYEIGSVSIDHAISDNSLVLDETCQSFVLLSPGNEAHTYSDESVNEIEYKCNICRITCNSSQALKYHKLIHNNQCQYSHTCKECGENFVKAQQLTHHFKSVHGLKSCTRQEFNDLQNSICNICGCCCVNENALMSHYKKHEPKPFVCNACNADYNNFEALNSHLKTHVTTLLYACSKCDAGFDTTSDLSWHLRMAHKPGKIQKINSKRKVRKSTSPVQIKVLKNGESKCVETEMDK